MPDLDYQLKLLSPRPGDAVVVQPDRVLSFVEWERIKQWGERVGLEVVALDPGWDLMLASGEDVTQLRELIAKLKAEYEGAVP